MKVSQDQVDLVLDVEVDYSDSVGSNSSADLRNFASHHQGNLKYREPAGMQCTSNAFFSIEYSVIKNTSIWKSWDLDYILEQGDIFFKSV